LNSRTHYLRIFERTIVRIIRIVGFKKRSE
jgi:hypothetical protein